MVGEAVAEEAYAWTGNIFLAGLNFSGRSELLKRAAGLVGGAEIAARRHSYVGPEVHNAISGLTQTVSKELELNGANQCPEIAPLVESSRLAVLAARNPFSLSGGEQALLAIAAAIVSGKDVCAIDCAAEQLDSDNRSLLFDWINKHPPAGQKLRVIADNRMRQPFCERRISLSCPAQTGPIIEPLNFRAPDVESHLLAMKDISFRYGRGTEWIFDRCTIELQPGRTYILRGPNGSGKSTWAKLLTGVLKPLQGNIFDNGKKLDAWNSPGQLVAYHFQNPDLQLFSTSVRDEIREGSGVPEELCCAIEATFGLNHFLSSHPLDLPFALRKRVALACTVASGRPWLIFDEPVLGQDANAATAIAKILKHLAQAGTGVIIISHDEWFDSLFDAIHLFIHHGQLEGTAR